MILYWIYNEQTGFTKFGITEDLGKRLNQLENQTGCKLTLIADYDFQHARQTELFLHSIYNSYRQKGEWFNISDNEAILAFNIFDTLFDSFKNIVNYVMHDTDEWIFSYSGKFNSSLYYDCYRERIEKVCENVA